MASKNHKSDVPVNLTFRMPVGRFNFRVAAIIIHKGHLLLIRNSDTSYLYMVGGRVQYNETTEEAVLREVWEETGVALEVDRAVFFQELFLDEEVTGEHFHEIGVYYLMKDSDELDNLADRPVKERGVTEELIWIPMDEMEHHYIVPETIVARLRSLPEHLERIVEIESR